MPQTVGQKKECAIQRQAQGGVDWLVLRYLFYLFVREFNEGLSKGGGTATADESVGQYYRSRAQRPSSERVHFIIVDFKRSKH